MPHADSSLVPSTIKTKKEFWTHINTQLTGLVEDQRSWVSTLANASSLIYHSLMAFDKFGLKDGAPIVNWCGFYLDSCLFPPKSTQPSSLREDPSRILLLGPFCGKPACQYIKARKGGGVCSDAYLSREPLVVPDVESYPGHIACDGSTQSEIVLPMKMKKKGEVAIEGGYEGTDENIVDEVVLGVLDLDSVVAAAFDEDDVEGLSAIVAMLVAACDW